MAAVDLLQRVGLNKYEADAYAALLAHGPLTGYELGKRSGVPLSRSYEIVERLAQKGLALVQPGDPPRYAAIPAERFVRQVRAETLTTLDALAAALAGITPRAERDELWVARGPAAILAQARALAAAAADDVQLLLPSAAAESLAETLAEARQRGCAVRAAADIQTAADPAAVLLILADGRRALAGCLEPPAHCQAVVGGNAGLVAAVGAALRAFGAAPAAERAPRSPAPLDWVAWEDRKQRRVWQSGPGNRVA